MSKQTYLDTRMLARNIPMTRAVIFGVVIAVVGGVLLLYSSRAATSGYVFTPSADTYITTSEKTTGHGSQQHMLIANGSGKCSDTRWCTTTTAMPYMKFAVTGLAPGSTVTNVSLRLYVVDGTDYAGDVYRVTNTSWSSAMTYEQAPTSNGTPIASKTSGIVKQTWVTFTLPANTIASNGTYAFMMKSASRDSGKYASAESTNRPQLILTTQSADITAPSAPTDLAASATQAGVSLQWRASTDNVGVTEYEVLRGGTKVASSTTTSFTDTGLAANTTYTYAVQAKDAAGNVSATSTPVRVTTAGLATTPSPAPGGGWKLIWAEAFDGSTLNTGNWSIRTGTEGHSQSNYLASNVSVAGGQLQLKTQRHCVGSGEALTSANASSAACPAGKTTKYSSGYVESKVSWNSGRMEVRAKLPTAAQGLWPAIWLRNTTGWCNTLYGELDILEWYYDTSGKPSTDQTTATTHVNCSGNATKHVAHVRSMGTDLTAGYHTWAVEWSPSSVKYEIDGLTVAANAGNSDKSFDTSGDFPSVSNLFETILDDAWKLRLNTQVIKPGDSWHSAPNSGATFAPATYYIDSVKVYQK